MKARLNLWIDRQLVDQAKAYSRSVGRPLSQIVENYFRVLGTHTEDNSPEITPIAKSLRGVLKGHDFGIETYRAHLEQKYK